MLVVALLRYALLAPGFERAEIGLRGTVAGVTVLERAVTGLGRPAGVARERELTGLRGALLILAVVDFK